MKPHLCRPQCPACGDTMTFAGAIPQLSGLSDMQAFKCRRCDLAVWGEAAAEVLEMAAVWPMPA